MKFGKELFEINEFWVFPDYRIEERDNELYVVGDLNSFEKVFNYVPFERFLKRTEIDDLFRHIKRIGLYDETRSIIENRQFQEDIEKRFHKDLITEDQKEEILKFCNQYGVTRTFTSEERERFPEYDRIVCSDRFIRYIQENENHKKNWKKALKTRKGGIKDIFSFGCSLQDIVLDIFELRRIIYIYQKEIKILEIESEKEETNGEVDDTRCYLLNSLLKGIRLSIYPVFVPHTSKTVKKEFQLLYPFPVSVSSKTIKIEFQPVLIYDNLKQAIAVLIFDSAINSTIAKCPNCWKYFYRINKRKRFCCSECTSLYNKSKSLFTQHFPPGIVKDFFMCVIKKSNRNIIRYIRFGQLISPFLCFPAHYERTVKTT